MMGLATIPRPESTWSASTRRRRRRGEHVGLAARARRPRPPAEPVLLTKAESARVMGMSISHFERHLSAELRCVYSGQLTLYFVADLRRWADGEPRLDHLGLTRVAKPTIPPILLTKTEAARVLSMSVSHFQRHVQPQLRCLHSGQLTLFPYARLLSWAEAEAAIGGRAVVA
jgi:hypothetical protein